MVTIRTYDTARRINHNGGNIRFDAAGYADVPEAVAQQLVAAVNHIRIEDRPDPNAAPTAEPAPDLPL